MNLLVSANLKKKVALAVLGNIVNLLILKYTRIEPDEYRKVLGRVSYCRSRWHDLHEMGFIWTTSLYDYCMEDSQARNLISEISDTIPYSFSVDDIWDILADEES